MPTFYYTQRVWHTIRSVRESVKARGGLLVVLAIGASLGSIHVRHAIDEQETVTTFLSGILIPMLFALCVFCGGVWLWRRQMDGRYVLRVAGWCALGALALSGQAGLMTLYQQGEGVKMSHQFYVLSNAASGGAVIGFIVGVYDSRQRAARRRSTQLGRQLTVLNRVLRHDIRNNVNVIQGRAELLTDDPADTVEQAQKIQQKSANLVQMSDHAREIEQLLQEDDPGVEPVDIVSRIETSRERVARDYPDAVFDVSLPEEIAIYAHPLIDSVVRNVIENAVEHNDNQPPRVTIESADAAQTRRDLVEIRVGDNGPGIPTEEREVLKRGYETPLKHTSGLGLWLVNWIVTESGGQVRFEENESGGSVVCLQFKRAQTAVPSSPAPTPSVADGTRH
jgi:signal transduction histidine kinase